MPSQPRALPSRGVCPHSPDRAYSHPKRVVVHEDHKGMPASAPCVAQGIRACTTAASTVDTRRPEAQAPPIKPVSDSIPIISRMLFSMARPCGPRCSGCASTQVMLAFSSPLYESIFARTVTCKGSMKYFWRRIVSTASRPPPPVSKARISSAVVLSRPCAGSWKVVSQAESAKSEKRQRRLRRGAFLPRRLHAAQKPSSETRLLQSKVVPALGSWQAR
mmetsp:Transcript_66553/g.168633  ORF Transcript_66553/g.168633 Transcript_66553/m.168633 type:complete len:219 (+) Transcript_66553:73-729(+)